MTVTAPPPPVQDRSRVSARLAVLVLLVASGIGAGVAAVVIAKGDNPADPVQVEMAQVQTSCGDWMGAFGDDSSRPDGEWCADMFAWMREPDGRTGMGSMMGRDDLGMRRACREWVTENRPELGTAGLERCDDMVTWMDDHLSGDGRRWMMRR